MILLKVDIVDGTGLFQFLDFGAQICAVQPWRTTPTAPGDKLEICWFFSDMKSKSPYRRSKISEIPDPEHSKFVFFKRKVHAFGKKRQPKSDHCSETSAKSKAGDTELSNGTSLARKLPRSTENGGFENQHSNLNLCFIALLSLVSLLSIQQTWTVHETVSVLMLHVNPLEIQVSNFKSTVLCAPWEFSSGTGTVGKLCVSCFAFCTRFWTVFTFWLYFFTKRAGLFLENHQVWVFGIRNFRKFGESVWGFRFHIAEKSRYL